MDITVFPYWKNGDDFADHLSNSAQDGVQNVAGAFESWANHMRAAAQDMESLAELLKGKDVEAGGDTHFSLIRNVPEDLRELVLSIGIVNEEEPPEDWEGDGEIFDD